MIGCHSLCQSSECIISIGFCLIDFVFLFFWIVVDFCFLCDIGILVITVAVRFHHFACLKVCVSHLFDTVKAVISVGFLHCLITAV